MAQLKGGTTISGYIATHLGNLLDHIKALLPIGNGTDSGIDVDTVDGKHASDFMGISGTGTAIQDLMFNTFTNNKGIYNGNWGSSQYWGLGGSQGSQVKIGRTDINGNYIDGDLQLVLGSSNKVVATVDQIPSSFPANGGNSDTVDGKHAGDFLTNNGNNGGTISGGGFPAQIMGTSTTSSGVSFHRPGAYAVNFGLDTDNVLKVGGWSMGNVSYPICHMGNEPSLVSSSGYKKFADGLIMQWGCFIPSSTTYLQNYAITFPSSCHSIILSPKWGLSVAAYNIPTANTNYKNAFSGVVPVANIWYSYIAIGE